MIRRILAVVLLLCASISHAQQSFRARVLSVTDGDTCRVERISNGREYRLRLYGVDAPESDQPFGQQARNVLNNLIDDHEIRVRLTGERDVARIYHEDVYVNRKLAEGWAWHYDPYTEGEEAEQFDAGSAATALPIKSSSAPLKLILVIEQGRVDLGLRIV